MVNPIMCHPKIIIYMGPLYKDLEKTPPNGGFRAATLSQIIHHDCHV